MRLFAVICWLVGAALILVPAVQLFRAWKGQTKLEEPRDFIIVIVVGVVVLATGGTIHRMARDSEDRRRRQR